MRISSNTGTGPADVIVYSDSSGRIGICNGIAVLRSNPDYPRWYIIGIIDNADQVVFQCFYLTNSNKGRYSTVQLSALQILECKFIAGKEDMMRIGFPPSWKICEKPQEVVNYEYGLPYQYDVHSSD